VIVEFSLQYNDGYVENVFSFVNNINTIEGGPISSVPSGLERARSTTTPSAEGMLKSSRTSPSAATTCARD
jgi:DNA gyrase subunit B